MAMNAGWIGGAFTLIGNRQQAHFSEQAQSRQQDFQKRMSGTAYRRAVYDMKQAGLNPMLAYSQGGASTPAGGAQNPAGHDPGGSYVRGYSAYNEAEVMKANIQKLGAQTENIRADTLGKMQIPDLVKAQTQTQGASAQHLTAQRDKLMYEIKELLPIQRQREILAGRLDISKAGLNKYELEKILPLIRDLKTIQRSLELLKIPRAKAEADAWKTSYGEKIRPYLGDLSTMINSAAAGIGGAAGLKYLLHGTTLRRGSGRQGIKTRKYNNED